MSLSPAFSIGAGIAIDQLFSGKWNRPPVAKASEDSDAD
jgi:hypothetical protein